MGDSGICGQPFSQLPAEQGVELLETALEIFQWRSLLDREVGERSINEVCCSVSSVQRQLCEIQHSHFQCVVELDDMGVASWSKNAHMVLVLESVLH